ncbi:unnamed protein product [Rodentolepis nana]|uniref:ZP domain-containing protein n=1 Tax=Rodentolepis nana TaxID=102285 RepID=A0A3P7W088_RODNA|nr:unnamed protein product [Rodentolepis nana]
MICYIPHWDAPYEELTSRMDTGAAHARLESASTSAGTAIYLKKASLFDESGQILQFSEALTSRSKWMNTATFSLFSGGRTEYQGTVVVVMKDSLLKPTSDLRLPFTCIDQKITRERQEEIFQSLNTHVNVSMTVVNTNLQEVDQVAEGENISLHFNLMPANNGVDLSFLLLRFILAFLFMQRDTIANNMRILNYRCTTNNEASRIQFEQSQLSDRQLQTQMFQVFRIDNFNSLFIRCFIKYCPQFTACSVENLDCSDPAQSYTGNKKYSHRYRLFDRWVHLNVASSPKESLLVTTVGSEGKGNANLRLNSMGRNGGASPGGTSSTDTGPCQYAVCLTHVQIISVSVITIVIILVVLSISLVALKRQNQFRRNELMASKKPNGAAYEYVNWSSPVNARNWGNQTSVFQPLVISDTIQRNPAASIASSVYSKVQLPNTTFIRSPNNAVSLIQNKCPGNLGSRCRNSREVKRKPTSEASGTWSVNRPEASGKKTFTSAVNEGGPFELQPLEFYETEAQGSVGLYAPFLCIRETGTIKNDTHNSECFVVANNSSISGQENPVLASTQFVIQKTPTITSTALNTRTPTLQRMYTRPPPAVRTADLNTVEPFSPMKFLTESENVMADRELSLSNSNILNDEQNV